MEHLFNIDLKWTGNLGHGTNSYTSYSRDHIISGKDKKPLECSSDPMFRGDHTKYNPEELFIGSLSACHMLWYLHLCADHGIIVIAYEDHPKGTMIIPKDSPGKFTSVELNPIVSIQNDDSFIPLAIQLHQEAHKNCFIANSCNFPVICNPQFN